MISSKIRLYRIYLHYCDCRGFKWEDVYKWDKCPLCGDYVSN